MFAIRAIAPPNISVDLAKSSVPVPFYQLSMVEQQFSTRLTSQIPLSHMLSKYQLIVLCWDYDHDHDIPTTYDLERADHNRPN
jgi:hypothetical protein